MENALYDKAREKFLKGEISWTTNTFRVALVDTASYTVDLATDEFFSDIEDYTISTSTSLLSKSATNGVADAAPATFTAVTGPKCEALVIYKDTGSTATSPLIAYIDTATGLPITPDGSDVIIWSSVYDPIVFIATSFKFHDDSFLLT
jgi:hypothetical protein